MNFLSSLSRVSLLSLTLLAGATMQLTAEESGSTVNLVKNGNFERLDDEGLPEGWAGGSNPSALSLLTKADSPSGKRAVRMTLDGTPTQFSQIYFFELDPGTTYTLSAYMRLERIEPEEEKDLAECLRIQLINVGWSYGTQTILPVPQSEDQWVRVSRTFEAPPSTRYRYGGQPNSRYKVMITAEHLHGIVDIDAIQLEAASEMSEVVLSKAEKAMEASVDPVTFDDIKQGFARVDYPVVHDPLYESLLEKETLHPPMLYYGWSDGLADQIMRPFAKKFAHRYVQQDEVDEIANHQPPYIGITSGLARGGVGSYPTLRQIFRPDAEGISPKVFDQKGGAWTLDPRFIEAQRQAALDLARQSLDDSPDNRWGNTFGLMMGDEWFESRAIKVPDRDRWYPEIEAADKEVREKFGFGRFGFPDSNQDKDPFKRIAHRRWANDRLTQFYKSLSKEIREINPELKLVAPILSGGVPPLDIEAISPYFDYFSNQSWNSPQVYVQMYATAADTKALVDLSSAPVIALPQHSAVPNRAGVREQFSQAYRNGAIGSVLLTTEWYDRELEHIKYIDTDKWHAIRSYTNMGRTQRKLRFPEPDTAILYASTTYLTFDTPKMATRDNPPVYANYIALGPETGSWFRFVSDRMIERGTAELSRYKVIYVPLATYESRSVLKALEKYIQNGGIVVAADPDAFSWAPDGTSLREEWEKVTGVRIEDSDNHRRQATMTRDGEEVKFPVPGRGMKILDPKIAIAARFDNEEPAMAIRPLGKGKIISFAANPFNGGGKNLSVARLVKSLQIDAGARIGHDIWRFMLPEAPPLPQVPAKGSRCLTGNWVKLAVGGPLAVSEGKVDGQYQWAAKTDEGQPGEWIPFSRGKLTNRAEAYEGRKRGYGRGPAETERWVVTFKESEVPPLKVDLSVVSELGYFSFYYSGEFPELTVLGSEDGEKWREMGRLPAVPFTPDVLEAGLQLSGKARYLKVTFGPKHQPLELAEMEIWSR